MSTAPKVIGQGSYGCVHKPSLKCKRKPKQNYTNKVSKILAKRSAEKELNEYKKVVLADKKKKFYLGIPDACVMDEKDADNMSAIRKCHIGDSILHSLNNYKLLIMEDGGMNLEDYTNTMKSWNKSEMSTDNCEKFLLETLRLFAGLAEFENNDLVHHDLKPQNIVYNEKTNRVNYIDFGLMETKSKLLNDARMSNYKWSIFHWSYPWELEVLDRNMFDKCLKSTVTQDSMVNQINQDIKNNTGLSRHIENFFYYSLDRSSKSEFLGERATYIFDYEITLKRDMKEMGYNEFLEKSMGTIDVFGLGMALKYWFHVAKKHLSPMTVFNLEAILSKMVTARLAYRLTVDESLFLYEQFIEDSGLLDKHDKTIVNHIVVDRTATGSPVKSPTTPMNVDMKFRPDPEFVNADPKPCPEGKEFNQKTRRCVLKCKEGYSRNPEFKCVRNKTAKLNVPDKHEKKTCPEGKEVNPKTGRCVNKCKEGYSRNAEFKCKKGPKTPVIPPTVSLFV
jgi:tRNA A-37 threonylcarbamoyl transferase component Bud32